MEVEHIIVLAEEPSMEAALRSLLPRMLGDSSFEVHAYQCKQDLLKRLPKRLKGYSKWLPENWRIVVLVDRDDDDCVALKRDLERIAADAGLRTRPGSPTSWQVANRIVIEELEAWFFGDWEAVRAAYPRVNPNVRAKARYRDADGIAGGTWEALERLLRAAGYFETGLRKIEAARAIAERMDPARNDSKSFHAFRVALEDGSRPTSATR